MIKQIFIDTETTGLDASKHGIYQLSGLVVYDNIIKEKFNIHLQPQSLEPDRVDQKALDVNNLTIDDLKKFQSMEDGFAEFGEVLTKHIVFSDNEDKAFFVAYNSNFDNQFVRSLFTNNGKQYNFNKFFWSNHIDVMTLSGFFLMSIREKMVNFKLTTVFNTLRQLGLVKYDLDKLGKAHDAMIDVIATKLIYDAVTNKENLIMALDTK